MNYNGLNVLMRVLEKDGGLIPHLIENTLFFCPKVVEEQAEEMLHLAQTDKLPVRFSTGEGLYQVLGQEPNARPFTNKTEAVKVSERQEVYTTLRPNIKIRIDKDGNYDVRKAIRAYADEIVSAGNISTIRNYMISHIWGNTADPFYFSALWNLALVPQHCSFILDKPDTHHEQIKEVKELFKAICWMLYRPDRLLGIEFADIPSAKALEQAESYRSRLKLIPE